MVDDISGYRAASMGITVGHAGSRPWKDLHADACAKHQDLDQSLRKT